MRGKPRSGIRNRGGLLVQLLGKDGGGSTRQSWMETSLSVDYAAGLYYFRFSLGGVRVLPGYD